jgi:uncharacterized protein
MKLIKKPLVIVGIDPGTTTGYAILDINGNLIKADSMRGMGLSKLISDVTYHGKPVLVGTDKANCPDFVYQVGAKTGARVVTPYADLLISEKRVYTIGQEFKNDHEADAIASAMFAHKKYGALFYKINTYLRNENKENLSDDVKRLMILRDGLSLADAVRLAEKARDAEPVNGRAQAESAEEELAPTKEEYRKLRERLARLETEYRQLKKSQESLLDEHEKVENIGEQELKSGPKKIFKLLRLREKQVKRLDGELKSIAKRNEKLKDFMSRLGPMVLLKKLDNLTYDEFLDKDKKLRIGAGDILLVANPNNHNKKTFEELKGKVSLILYKQKITSDIKNIKELLFIDASKLQIEELAGEDFALADKLELEKLRKEPNLVLDMFARYKESRKKEGSS